MKTILSIVIGLGLLVPQTFGQGAQGAQITQRARELVNQNNIRQGVQQPSQAPGAHAPATPGTAQAQKPVAPNPAQIQLQFINKIKTDIATIRADAQPVQEKVQKLGVDLLASARGPRKPTAASANKLAASLAGQLAGKTLDSAQETRLAQDLEAVVNGARISQLQADAYVSDVQAILQVAGAKRADALAVAEDVKAVLKEVRP